eukprot:scaffold51458_cov24-Cyclotella_meneghiniana.AAC.4
MSGKELPVSRGQHTPLLAGVVDKGIAPRNSSKLLEMLLDPVKSRVLKIQLSAYVEGLRPLRDACYYLESDATDLPFKVAARLEEYQSQFPSGSMMNLPSTERLIMEAIDWAHRPVAEGGGGFVVGGEVAPLPAVANVATVVAAADAEVRRRPRRTAAAGATAAVRALETTQQRNLRERAEAAAAAALVRDEQEAARLAALERAAASATRPPLTKTEWEAVAYSGLATAVEYVMERINEGGDRFQSMEFFKGARIFDPTYAKNLTRDEAFAFIDKLGNYPILAKGGNDSILNKLKKTWSLYQAHAKNVLKNFGKTKDGDMDDAAIASWHYKLHLRSEKLKSLDNHCRYCTSHDTSCGCYDDIKVWVWWEACELVTLVLPSSATAERVFSFAKHLFGDKQSSLLTDALQLSLFLAFNKRK